MKLSRFWLVLIIPGLLAALWGCLPASFYPYYSEKDLISSSFLPGLWQGTGDKESYLFKKRDKANEYSLEIISGEDSTLYTAHLFKLGNRTYLDIYPEKRDLALGLIPGHVAWLCQVEQDRMVWTHFNYGYIQEELDNGKMTGIKYLESDGSFLLNAPTQELQAFILKYEKAPKFFDEDPFVLHRVNSKEIKPKEEVK